MGLERRGNNFYYYYSYRGTDGKPKKQYLGRGEHAELMYDCSIITDQIFRWDKAEEKIDENDLVFDHITNEETLSHLEYWTDLWVATFLKTKGYHKYKGQWRKKRMNTEKPISQDKESTAICGVKQQEIIRKRMLQLERITEVNLINTWTDYFFHGWEDEVEKRSSWLKIIQADCDQIREGLGYSESSELEKLLIHRIIACFLNVSAIEVSKNENIKRRYGIAVASFNRACTALARIRRLYGVDTAIQINIANMINQIKEKE